MFVLTLSENKLDYVASLVKAGTSPHAILSCKEDSFYQDIHLIVWHRKYPNFAAISRFSGFKL